MTENQLIGERVARMETELKYLQRDVTEVKGDVADIKAKQDQMIAMMTEAKGGYKTARWVWGVVVVALGLLFAYWSAFKAFLLKVGG